MEWLVGQCREGHQVKDCIEEHWMNDDVMCFKVDMKTRLIKTDYP